MKHYFSHLTIGILMLSLGLSGLSANASTLVASQSQTTLIATGDNPILGARHINDALTSSRHDNYGWAMAVHEQNTGNYLWLGTNRDLGGMVALNAAPNPQIAIAMIQMFGLSFDPTDQAGRIYRTALGGDDYSWELMYKNPAINGWRAMQVFNGDLYVFAGLTNRIDFTTGQPIPANNWSAIFRFGSDFLYGDEPEIVMWETLPGATIEYFRSGTITRNAQGEDEFLYIGTASGKVWRTNGTGLQALTPNEGVGNTGWELVVDLVAGGYVGVGGTAGVLSGMIWDLMAFNGSVYAFVANQVDGFEVFRLNGNNVTPIVSRAGIYQPGLGISQHVAASPFKVTIDGKDFVYVTTFANGPRFLSTLIQMDFATAFTDIYMPAAMYRFGTNGTWEVVVGDEGMALRNDDTPVPHATGATERAGFFLGDSENTSSNQYIWWMEQHDGRIFASTFDVGNFRDDLALAFAWLAGQAFDGLADEIVEAFTEAFADVSEAATNLITDIGECVMEIAGIADEILEAIQDDIDELTGEITELLGDLLGVDFEALEPHEIEQLLEELFGNLAILLGVFSQNVMVTIEEIAESHGITGIEDLCDLEEPLADFAGAIVNFVDVAIEFVEEGNLDQMLTLLDAVVASAPFLADNSNPAGFDLFVSDDGVIWEPVTISGFGNPQNYGGRVILSTDYGLFITTANPFSGFDIFKLEDFYTELRLTEEPPTEEIELEAGQPFTLYVQTFSFGVYAPELSVSANISGVVGREISLDEETPENILIPQVEIEIDIFGGRRFVESLQSTVGIHEIELTFNEAFTGEVMITIDAEDLQIRFPLNVKIAQGTTISEVTAETPIKVYPNPFTDNITIVDAEGSILNVLNMNGAVIHTQRITSPNETIYLGHLPSGTYILRTGNHVVVIVKQ